MQKMSKHLMRMVMAAVIATICPTYAMAQAATDSVTIGGIVTDYAGQPIDSCMVDWMDSRFETITEAISGKDGRYSARDRKSTRLNSSHANISYAVFCLKKKNSCPT